MKRYLAQEIKLNNTTIKGPLPDEISTVSDIINIIMDFLIPLSGAILFLILVWGGYSFMSSRGEAEKVKTAKAVITSGIIGFVLLIMSYFIVKFIAFLLDIQPEGI